MIFSQCPRARRVLAARQLGRGLRAEGGQRLERLPENTFARGPRPQEEARRRSGRNGGPVRPRDGPDRTATRGQEDAGRVKKRRKKNLLWILIFFFIPFQNSKINPPTPARRGVIFTFPGSIKAWWCVGSVESRWGSVGSGMGSGKVPKQEDDIKFCKGVIYQNFVLSDNGMP